MNTPNCNPFDKCEIFSDKRPEIVLKDKNSKCSFRGYNLNHHNICNLRVDGCLIKGSHEEKCDFLLLKCTKNVNTAYFVEIKGTNLVKAVRQINNSLNLLLPKMQQFTIINGRIISSRVDKIDITHSDYKALARRMKKLNGTLVQKTILMEEFL